MPFPFNSIRKPGESNGLARTRPLQSRSRGTEIPRIVIRLLAILLGLIFVISGIPSAQAQTYTVLYSFTGVGNGRSYGGLTQDSKGNLYGANRYGGEWGEIFRLDASAKESVVWSSSGGDLGIYPYGGPVFANGFLYAATSLSGFGCGVLFRLDLNGRTESLHTFGSPTQNADGCVPQGDLIRDAAGSVYGTTASGGTFGFGTVYKIDASGTYTLLYNFAGPPNDGRAPSPGALILDAAGNMYGVTVSGGSHNFGTIFSIDPTGKETVLYNFTGAADGKNPHGSLARTASGLLVATVSYGGTSQSCSGGCGVVFRVDMNGKGDVLHTFEFSVDGGLPSGGLVRDATGNLYGTTTVGGPLGHGVVFKLDPSGRETILHSFSSRDGAVPFTTLLLDSVGNLYGTTLYGGAEGQGVIFKITQ